MSDRDTVLDRVRRALGRTGTLTAPPTPPVLNEPLIRLVHSDIGLPELFANRAAAAKMTVDALYVEELLPHLVKFLTAAGCKNLGLPVSKLFAQIQLVEGLKEAGFNVCTWDELTLDEAYDLDCGITDVFAAIAETGSLAIRFSPDHGRALSLVPPIQVAILEPKNFVADLVDFFEKLGASDRPSGTVLITGPSKTADIEGSLVIGVHGPGRVHIFSLQ